MQRRYVTASALLLALVAPTGLLVAAQSDALPPGCERVEGFFRCEFTHDTRTSPIENVLRYPLPASPQAAATIIVDLDGVDRGWRTAIVANGGDAFRTITQTFHIAATDGNTNVREENSHLVLHEPIETIELVLATSAIRLPTGGYVYGVVPPSTGVFTILYLAEELPEGSVPSRPPATREDPHLTDLPLDAEEDVDIRSAWFDDERLDDGVIEAHLALADLLRWAPGTTGQQGANSYTLAFTIAAEPYAIGLTLFPDTAGPGIVCGLLRGEAARLVANPACSLDAANGTITMRILERAIGPPPAGRAFEDMEATTSSAADGLADEARTQRYAFALGGPTVWSALNPRLDPVVTTAAWYDAPLADGNLSTTLQVAGALFATASTALGVLIVSRNRRQTRALLERVDALAARTDQDTRAALLALGDLESEFAALFRNGKINETQYQVATQRVVAAASRIALRKELGLDDGAPG